MAVPIPVRLVRKRNIIGRIMSDQRLPEEGKSIQNLFLEQFQIQIDHRRDVERDELAHDEPAHDHQTQRPTASTVRAPTQRDRHLQSIAKHGRMGWQKRSGYTRRALVEAAISRLKRVIGNGLRSRTEHRRATEVAIAVHALNRMLELGRPKSVRTA